MAPASRPTSKEEFDAAFTILKDVGSGRFGQVPGLLQQLPEQARQHLQQYLHQAGLNIQ